MTPKPQAKTIDEIFANLTIKLLHPFKCTKNDCYQVGEEIEHFGIDANTAKQQLLAEVLDMIGEDELYIEVKQDNNIHNEAIMHRNHAKADFRRATKERFK